MPQAPAASRRYRVIDIRLLIGIALIVASVAGVVAVVGATDHRVPVYAATSTLTPGERIEASDLVVRRVSLDSADDLYLAPGDLPDGGLITLGVVRTGELVPLAAVGGEDAERSTSIVIDVSGRVSAAVVPGAIVDVWSAAGGDGGVAGTIGFGPPTVLIADAVVIRVIDDEGLVASSEGDSVEVLVPRARIARLLQAIADGDALAVVPAGITLESR